MRSAILTSRWNHSTQRDIGGTSTARGVFADTVLSATRSAARRACDQERHASERREAEAISGSQGIQRSPNPDSALTMAA